MKSDKAASPQRMVCSVAEARSVSATQTIVLGGAHVTAALNTVDLPEGWIPQDPRRGTKGLRSVPVMVCIAISEEMANVLHRVRFADIRLAYDSLIRHVLKQPTDAVLLAGHTSESGTWVTELVKQGSSLVHIQERQLRQPSHPQYQAELVAVLEELMLRFPACKFDVAVPGFDINNTPEWRDVSATLYRKPAIGDVKLKSPRVALKFLALPALAAAFAVAIGIFAISRMESSIKSRVQDYQTAVTGVEEDFKKGLPMVEKLETQKAYLTGLESQINLASGARRIITATAAAGEAIFIDSKVTHKPDGALFKLRFALVPEISVGVIEQATPVVERIAANLGAPVQLRKYSEERFGGLSTTVDFRVYEISGVIAPDLEQAPTSNSGDKS